MNYSLQIKLNALLIGATLTGLKCDNKYKKDEDHKPLLYHNKACSPQGNV